MGTCLPAHTNLVHQLTSAKSPFHFPLPHNMGGGTFNGTININHNDTTTTGAITNDRSCWSVENPDEDAQTRAKGTRSGDVTQRGDVVQNSEVVAKTNASGTGKVQKRH